MIAAGGGAFAVPETRERAAARAPSPSGCAARWTTLLDAHPRRRQSTAGRESCDNRGRFWRARAHLRPRGPDGRHDADRARGSGAHHRGGRHARPQPRAEGRRSDEVPDPLGHPLQPRGAHRRPLVRAPQALGQGACFLGDLVGYGANPNQTVDMVRDAAARWSAIRGNHDKVCSGIEDGELFNRMALEAAMWTRRKLTRSNLRVAEEAARGSGDGGRHLRDLPRHADRRGRLHLRRDRGPERLPPHRLPHLASSGTRTSP